MIRSGWDVTRSEAAFRVAALMLCLVTASAVWIESDAYRYSGGILIMIALADYARTPTAERPIIGWLGYACLGWSAYVGLRYAWDFLHQPANHGSAEGLYLFPLLFPSLGYAFYRMRDRLHGLPDLFMIISAVMLGATIDFSAVFSGDRVPFLIQNNTIHASVAAGIISVCAIAYAENASRNWSTGNHALRSLRVLLALAVIALCLIGIYGAKSKGVWLALGLTLPLQALGTLVHLPPRRALLAGVILLLGAGLILLEASPGLIHELAPPAGSALALLDAARSEGLVAVNEAIRAGTVPFSFNERLMLWMNAAEVVAAYPLFGAGITWQQVWETTTYAHVPYTLMHNGYVEVLIRYGITGLVFLLGLYAAFAWQIWRSARAGLIAPAAAKTWFFSSAFFALTLATNSNNRLAIGESLLLTTAAFTFYACYLTQFQVETRSR